MYMKIRMIQAHTMNVVVYSSLLSLRQFVGPGAANPDESWGSTAATINLVAPGRFCQHAAVRLAGCSSARSLSLGMLMSVVVGTDVADAVAVAVGAASGGLRCART